MTETDGTFEWASQPMMSPIDTLMWRGEADRRLRNPICAVELLDCAPDWDRLVAAHDWGTRMVPRFRQRVQDSPFGIGAPSWAVDPEFDLHYHLRRARVPGDGSFGEIIRAAEQIAMTPLDPARSPWEAVLFDGLPDGKAVYLLKVHHAMTDGMGAIDLLAGLHSEVRDPVPDKPQPPPPTPEQLGPLTVIGRQLTADLNRLPGAISGLARAAMGVRNPRRAIVDAARYCQSALKVAGASSPPGSPLLSSRSISWRFSAFDIEFADLRAASKRAGASVNDAYLAGLISAFRLYHLEMGHPISVMPVAIPISVRSADDPAGGNRIAIGRLVAQVDIADPRELMMAIRAEVDTALHEPAVDLFNMIGPALAWLPGAAMSLLAAAASVNDLQASNVPGIARDAYLAGAKVERMYPFGPLPGCAVMAGMVTHGPIACLGINFDAAAIVEPDLFSDCVVEGFANVLTLAPNASRPIRRV